MDKKQKALTRKYLQVTYSVANEYENRRSKPSHGRLYYVHKTGFWIDVPSIEVDGMHISFGSSTLIRNSLEMEIHTAPPLKKIALKGEVEWYELITSGKDYKFHVGISILEISQENRKNFNKLLDYYNEHLNLG